MATFEPPDYVIGNSATITSQLSSVLTQLDQALQALQPSPSTNVVQFNNMIVLADSISSNQNTMSNGTIVIGDGSNSSIITATSLNLTDATGDTQLNESLNSIEFQNNNTSLYCQMGTQTQNSGLNGIEGFNSSAGTYFQLSTDINPNNPTLALLDGYGVLGSYTSASILLDGASAGRHTDITLIDGTNTCTLRDSSLLFSNTSFGNAINIDASTQQIIITDGTTTNTINKNGYTTHNTSANATYYLNFSDASATGIGAIQKTAGISCNPSTNTITATTFAGNSTNATNCSTTSTTTSGTYYPVFVSSNATGNYPNLVGVMTYNPSTNTITANTFNGLLSGTATNATNVGVTSDNTNGTYYLPFIKTSGTGNKPIFIDDITGPLSYNPSTSNLSASIFTGSANITNAVNNVSIVATTLTLDFSTLTFKNFYNSTAITTAITQSAISFSNAVAGGSYMVYITTGVGGSFTFNTGITNVKTTFSTAFTIPASSVGVMSIYYINSVYIVGINILT